MTGSYRYTVHRPRVEKISEGRSAFVKDRLLCGKMAEAFRDDSPDRNPDSGEAGFWNGFPWLTMVLGSGCLDLPRRPGFNAASLSAAVARCASADPRLPPVPEGSESWATIGSRFAGSLAETRHRLPDRVSGEPPPAVEVDPVSVHMVLIAALLSRLHHAGLAVWPTAARRQGSQVTERRAASPLDDPWRLEETVVAPLRQLIEVATQEMEAGVPPGEGWTPAMSRTVVSFLREVEEGLRPQEAWCVNLDHVRLMTEISWYFLDWESGTYHGWTELLVGLLLNETIHEQGYRRRRPKFNDLKDLPKQVKDLILEPTKLSWMELDPERSAVGATPAQQDSAAPVRLHTALARVLRAQAAAVRRPPLRSVVNQEGRALELILPGAVAFSTSFDIELEMALWALGEAFSIALPVHVSHGDSAEVELCWLLADVDPSVTQEEQPDPGPCEGVPWLEQLSILLRPRRWRLLAQEPDEQLRTGLTVVHMNGCPLLDLAAINEGGEERTAIIRVLESVDVVVAAGDKIDHSVTVDEYLALRQAEAELFWSMQRALDPLARNSRGLSKILSEDGPEQSRGNPRYWLVAGVPISDPAVRQRVMSQLTARWIHRMMSGTTKSAPSAGQRSAADAAGRRTKLRRPGDRPPEPVQEELREWAGRKADPEEAALAAPLQRSLSGVAVNSTIDADEAALLSWLGLDVVRGDCHSFVRDLLDYEAHLLTPGPNKRLLGNAACPLGGSG